MEQRVQVRANVEVPSPESEQIAVRGKYGCRNARKGRHVLRRQRADQCSREQDKREHQRQGGQQTACAADVEARQVETSRGFELGDERRSDDETRDGEEDVDAHEASGDRKAGMEGDHEQDRYCAEPLDVPSTATVRAGDRGNSAVARRLAGTRAKTRVEIFDAWRGHGIRASIESTALFPLIGIGEPALDGPLNLATRSLVDRAPKRTVRRLSRSRAFAPPRAGRAPPPPRLPEKKAGRGRRPHAGSPARRRS